MMFATLNCMGKQSHFSGLYSSDKTSFKTKLNTPVRFSSSQKSKEESEKISETRQSILAMLKKDFLRGLGKRPRVHPNGFIQLDLTPRRRLHVWGHPDIPKRDAVSHIHDHVFGFRSWGVVGRLVNIVYDLLHGGQEFEIHQGRITKGDDGVLETTGIRCGIKPKSIDVIVPHQKTSLEASMTDHYDLKPNEFHETFVSEPTATVIDKDGETLGQRPNGAKPRILLPTGQKIDNSFSRYTQDEDKLWKIIEDVLKL